MSKRILHVITGLRVGGAEMILTRLLEGFSPRFENEVLSLTGNQPIGERIRDLGISVHALHVPPGKLHPRLLTGVAGHIRRFRPDLIQTWMYHADLIGGVAAHLVGDTPVIWNIRNTIESRSDFKPSTYAVMRICALLSSWMPHKIFCCAESARVTHLSYGYAAEKIQVIPNGIDMDMFRPDMSARIEVCRELGLDSNARLIGLAARFDPQKDHYTFIKAATLLHKKKPDVHFVMWGEAVDNSNQKLMSWIREGCLESSTHLLGFRSDVSRLTAALDVASLSSAYGEAFPNVVAEAMACGIPCVVTDVGDAALIVSEYGKVVGRRDPLALAQGWAELLDIPDDQRAFLGQRARHRIVELFSVMKMKKAYVQSYEDIIEHRQ